MWRVVVYMFLPAAFVIQPGLPDAGNADDLSECYQVTTLEPAAMGTTDNGQPKQQTIVMGPLAAFVPMKMMGTNGGGFFGMNSAHPFENPSAGNQLLQTFCMMLFPMALVLMYGRMLRRLRHAMVIFSVMLLLFVGTVVWAIYFDTMQPNPGLTAHPTEPNIHDCERQRAGRQARHYSAGRGGTAGRSASRQSRGQGAALRNLGRRDLRRGHG